MIKYKYELKSKIWVYPGFAAWRFLTLPKKEAQIIKRTFSKVRRGFGSLPVAVTIGKTTWNTSIFPDSKSGSYVLPLKAQVRKKENIKDNQIIKYKIEIRMLRLKYE